LIRHPVLFAPRPKLTASPCSEDDAHKSQSVTPANRTFMRSLLIVGVLSAVLAASLSAAEAANRKVDIVNKTGMEMKHFYASNTGTSDWEEDILGRDVLDDGETFEADIDDGTGACRFDFKGVFANGNEVVKKNVNVCEISTFTFRP
jgi:hypothetical protein